MGFPAARLARVESSRPETGIQPSPCMATHVRSGKSCDATDRAGTTVHRTAARWGGAWDGPVLIHVSYGYPGVVRPRDESHTAAPRATAERGRRESASRTARRRAGEGGLGCTAFSELETAARVRESAQQSVRTGRRGAWRSSWHLSLADLGLSRPPPGPVAPDSRWFREFARTPRRVV